MFEPLKTERLIIRAPEIGDTEALHRRRNHPETAQYQDWTVPYPLEAARRLIAGAASMDGPTDGEWWMATVLERNEAGGAGERPVGDLAVHLGSGGRGAELGYSIEADRCGRGYATEAAGALVDHLTNQGVQRWSASTHPDNTASVRVLERLGFGHEGRTVASYFEPDPNVAPTDDLLFGMTAEDRRAWLQRPTGRPSQVRLVTIDHTNQHLVAKLATHYWQRNFVATVAQSYADALFPEPFEGRPVQPWLRAIEITEADGQVSLAGFVMLAWPLVPEDEPYLWRLLIDRWHQGRSIASQALDQIDDLLRADGQPCIATSWVPGPGSPEPFYLARGYVLTGEEDDGELVGRKVFD